jgi:hypothetical protein
MAAETQSPPESQEVLRGGLLTDVVVPIAAATIVGPGSVATAKVADTLLNHPPADPPPEVVLPTGVEKPE